MEYRFIGPDGRQYPAETKEMRSVDRVTSVANAGLDGSIVLDVRSNAEPVAWFRMTREEATGLAQALVGALGARSSR